jgi:glycosidase
MKKHWWQDAVLYQVYLRSFKDSNGDGIGDIPGVISKLDYLKSLGVNTLWVSPHYDSPMDDNGYDVRDFYKVAEEYGTLDDFKALLKDAHDRNMYILIDLVLNHTSDEHAWFEAAKDPQHPDHETYHDYYIWHPGKILPDGSKEKPTQWISWFGGSVWEYNAPTDEYYLHIFSKKMPDLNWRNQAMKKDLKAMIKWWIDLGIDGFRVDASNHLEKNWEFPDASPGYEHFSSLPKHHEYLQELAEALFIPHELLIIGEAGGASKEEALDYAGFDSKKFNLLIHFSHVWVDGDDSNRLTPGKWAKGTVQLKKIKEALKHWVEVFHEKGWNTLYWHNHDHPRIVSHYGNDSDTYREKSAKMLALMLYVLPGTPIIYQGEEIGMTNVDYQNLSDFRDVEVFTEYENFIRNGASHEVAMQALRDRSRDNARSPMPWSDEVYAGFSTQEPWIPLVKNYPLINVQKNRMEKDSILSFYQDLLMIRKSEELADQYPHFDEQNSSALFAYQITGKHHDIYVIGNFTDQPQHFHPTLDLKGYQIKLSNDENNTQELSPYEARLYMKKR